VEKKEPPRVHYLHKIRRVLLPKGFLHEKPEKMPTWEAIAGLGLQAWNHLVQTDLITLHLPSSDPPCGVTKASTCWTTGTALSSRNFMQFSMKSLANHGIKNEVHHLEVLMNFMLFPGILTARLQHYRFPLATTVWVLLHADLKPLKTKGLVTCISSYFL
jgi:hypothetical protein